tara:strand:+ start:520 stop:684 length:165 start_codon:yes stop_codon:yes gene_type:complete
MVKLELKEIIYVHKIISEQDIKGADAPFVANIINKLVIEHEKLNKLDKEVTNKK